MRAGDTLRTTKKTIKKANLLTISPMGEGSYMVNGWHFPPTR